MVDLSHPSVPPSLPQPRWAKEGWGREGGASVAEHCWPSCLHPPFSPLLSKGGEGGSGVIWGGSLGPHRTNVGWQLNKCWMATETNVGWQLRQMLDGNIQNIDVNIKCKMIYSR